MVLDYYSLKEQPFGVTADPRYLYLSPTHREALASLAYGVQSGRGFMSIIAQPGMGKTTILFQLLSQLEGSARTVFLFQTLCRPEDLLRGLLRDLGVIDDGKDVVRMQTQLNDVLWAEARQGRKVVVVIDEAQNLEDSALELVRMLSNFETTSDKLMQIVLGGQPQLRDKLVSPQLLQLRQRMSILARLHPFNAEETHLYIQHRLRVAGYSFQTPLFTPQAEALIAQHSRGIPRNINNICFNALSLGWVLKQRSIQKDVVREVLADLDLESQTADDLAEARLRRTFIAFNAIKPTRFLKQVFAWRTRLALSAVILAPLLFFSGRKSQNIVGAASMPMASATLQKPASSTAPLPSATGLLNTGGADAKHEQRPEAESGANHSVQRTSQSLQATRTHKPQLHSETSLARASDPAGLWQQVKKGRGDAEVELGQMYLEGIGVAQNCAQARVLLQDAFRKGNSRAGDLLNDSVGRCQ